MPELPGGLSGRDTPGPCTFPALLCRNSASYGGKPAIIGDGAAISHAELDRDSRALAVRLVAAGVARSARVGLIMRGGADWAVTAAAVMRIGRSSAPRFFSIWGIEQLSSATMTLSPPRPWKRPS